MSVLELTEVTKRYRNGHLANDAITLSVEAGEVFGLLGPNGAGKTTLVRQVMGLLPPTSGDIHIDGVDVVRRPGHAQVACSYQPQGGAAFEGLTPTEALELVGRIRGGERLAVRRRSDELITLLDLGAWANKRMEMLSGGVARLVAFCLAAV